MYYEQKKHDGSLPLIGVNTFLPKDHGGEIATEIELIRSTEEEKGQQIENVQGFGKARNSLAPESLKVLQNTARECKNVFEQLMEAVKCNSLGQISHALYDERNSGQSALLSERPLTLFPKMARLSLAILFSQASRITGSRYKTPPPG